jgi:hypothetical protein
MEGSRFRGQTCDGNWKWMFCEPGHSLDRWRSQSKECRPNLSEFSVGRPERKLKERRIVQMVCYLGHRMCSLD